MQEKELEKEILTKNYATNITLRNYLFFWVGQLVSLLGSTIVQFSIIWWITVETGSAIFLSIASVLTFLPQLFIIPIAGVFADKWNRRLALIFIDFSQALITFILALIFIQGWGTVWIVILFNSLRSIFQAFHMPTVDSLVPSMIPKDKLTRINSFNNLFRGLIRFSGPIIGASLLAFWSLKVILWVDVITFTIALVPLILISIPTIEKDRESQEKTSFMIEFKEGLSLLKTTPGFLILALWSLLANFLTIPYTILLPYYVKITHLGTESHLAMLLAFMQAGSIAGSLVISLKKIWERKVLILMVGATLSSVGILIAALAPVGIFLIIGIGEFILGFTLATGLPVYFTILQTAVSPDKQGRIFSIDATLSFAIMPLGMIIAGPLANFMGIVNFFILLGILGIIVNLMIYFLTNLRNIEY
ncbi:MAG: MFS transporter [Promethearchaeota archaeon]|jgi:DHA3 family macrolide efflux protein-like MFS transporter